MMFHKMWVCRKTSSSWDSELPSQAQSSSSYPLPFILWPNKHTHRPIESPGHDLHLHKGEAWRSTRICHWVEVWVPLPVSSNSVLLPAPSSPSTTQKHTHTQACVFSVEVIIPALDTFITTFVLLLFSTLIFFFLLSLSYLQIKKNYLDFLYLFAESLFPAYSFFFQIKTICYCSASLHVKSLQLCLILWDLTGACQAPLSMGFSRQEYWIGLPFPPPGDHPNPEIKRASAMSPALVGWFFTTSVTWEAVPKESTGSCRAPLSLGEPSVATPTSLQAPGPFLTHSPNLFTLIPSDEFFRACVKCRMGRQSLHQLHSQGYRCMGN